MTGTKKMQISGKNGTVPPGNNLVLECCGIAGTEELNLDYSTLMVAL